MTKRPFYLYLPGILALLAILAMLALGGCRKGPHVEPTTVTIYQTKFKCDYSDSVLKADRTVALCDTQAECNAICAGLPR